MKLECVGPLQIAAVVPRVACMVVFLYHVTIYNIYNIVVTGAFLVKIVRVHHRFV